MFHQKVNSKQLPDHLQKSYSSCSVSASVIKLFSFLLTILLTKICSSLHRRNIKNHQSAWHHWWWGWHPPNSWLPAFSALDPRAGATRSMSSSSRKMWGSPIFACGKWGHKRPVCAITQPILPMKLIRRAIITTINLTNTRQVSRHYFKLYNSKSEAQS